jgi:hypothetical protein
MFRGSQIRQWTGLLTIFQALPKTAHFVANVPQNQAEVPDSNTVRITNDWTKRIDGTQRDSLSGLASFNVLNS